MTTPTPETETAAVSAFEQFARLTAEQHAEQCRAMLPELLRGMPMSPGNPAEVHAALDLLSAAMKETALNTARQDAPGTPASYYGAALIGYALALGVFLFELEPEEPTRAAALFITYAARYRDQYSASTPDAAAFLEEADAGTLTPETAHRALNAFPDFPTLAGFLAAHHALSLSCEALGDPGDFHPREQLGEALAVIRREVYTVQVSGSAEA